RLGYTNAVLSESINDSLMALGIACAIALTAQRYVARRVLVAAFTCVVVLWMFARDTNAVVALCGVVILNARRVPIGYRIASIAVAGVAVFVLWSTTVTPPPTRLTFHGGWQPELTARGAPSTLNTIFDLVLPDPAARAYFEQRGLPQAN